MDMMNEVLPKKNKILLKTLDLRNEYREKQQDIKFNNLVDDAIVQILVEESRNREVQAKSKTYSPANMTNFGDSSQIKTQKDLLNWAMNLKIDL